MFEKGPTTGVLRCYLLVVVVVVAAALVIVVERYLCLRCVLYTRKIIFTVVSSDKAESVDQRNSTHMPFVCVVFWRVMWTSFGAARRAISLLDTNLSERNQNDVFTLKQECMLPTI